jgi:hypothetical protein
VADTQHVELKIAVDEDETQTGLNQPGQVTDPSPRNYHIIAASFRERDKAEEFMVGLRDQGYSPQVLSDDNGNFRVSYMSFLTKKEALTELPAFRERVNQNAWFLFAPVEMQ